MKREDAIALLTKYNTPENLFHHAYAVEATMREFAQVKGQDVEYWAL